MRLVGRTAVLLTGALLASAAVAGVAGGLGPSSGRGYDVVGPFTNPDQADVTTCGRIWAHGRLTQTYKVFPQRTDGSYLVLEQGDVRYVSEAGQSVGACNNGQPDNGNTVGDGIRVTSTFQALWVIRNGTFDPTATCPADRPSCFIVPFTRSFFGSAATFELVNSTALYETPCNGSWLGDAFLGNPAAGDITGPKIDCDQEA